MDPAKSADLVLLHLAAEVQQIISELQVSEANLTMMFFTSEVQEVFPSLLKLSTCSLSLIRTTV